MTLNDIELRHGTRFSSECRVRRPIRRTATNGSKYLSFAIEDCSRSLKAYAWPDHCDSSVCVLDLDKVIVSGKIREFNGEWLANITSIQHTEVVAENALQLIPHSLCPLSPLLERLRTVVGQISNEALRNFVGWVFSDDSFTLPFINLPASRRHHHALAGGLLEHSLECAEMVCRFSEFRQDHRDLAVVGALLHDAGKIMTLRNSDRFSPTGYILDHDALTLEVLSPYLRRLDTVNPDVATALRYLWTWRHHRRGNVHPILTVAEAISAADRISSALNVEEEAFRERPDWQRFVRHGTTSSLFWRPRLEQHYASSP
jgi:3'-5' exoribonuclease